MFLKESYLDTNPYDGDPLSASDNLDSPGGISSHIQAAVLHSKLFNWSGNAQKVYSETNDARQGLLAAYVESAALENIQNPIVPCMKFLLQHHVKACRLVLAEHERPYWGYRRIEQQGPGWHNRPGSEELPGSWQRLERLLQHLKSQKIAVMRLRATSPEITGTRLEHELEEFELLIEEMAAVVGHKRARLDHQLNETLLLESRANLKVANMTIKESRGTRMCKSRYMLLIVTIRLAKCTRSDYTSLHLHSIQFSHVNFRYEPSRAQSKWKHSRPFLDHCVYSLPWSNHCLDIGNIRLTSCCKLDSKNLRRLCT